MNVCETFYVLLQLFERDIIKIVFNFRLLVILFLWKTLGFGWGKTWNSAMAWRQYLTKHRAQAEKEREEELQQIVVIGYACQTFVDDPKHQWFEEERHLIVCPADTTGQLKIDRCVN